MNGHEWIAKEDDALRTLYPHLRSDEVARILGRSRSAIYGRAKILCLTKSEAYNLSALSGRMVKGYAPYGAAYRFKQGQAPANKGLRRPGWHAGRMRETQFKKGQTPANKDPDFYVIGALRVNSDGYIDMRVSFAKGAMGWRALHRILWEDAHGPIAKGHVLVFKDRDTLNVCLENLELITRAEHCLRNSIHNLPKPLKHSIQLLGQLKRRIREKQDRGSARPPVRDAGGTAGQGETDGSGPRQSGGERGAGDRGFSQGGSGARKSNRRARRIAVHAAAAAA